MSIYSAQHPDITSGAISSFGFHKVSQQTKTVLVNMLMDFVDYRNQLFKSDIYEVNDFQTTNDTADKKLLYILRDFAAVQRKFPSVVISIQNAVEQKPYVGADNFLYTDSITLDGNMALTDIYAGMAQVECMFTIMCESSDQRSKLADMLFICFSNYFRGQFMYRGSDNSQFIITPAITPIAFGSEQEVIDANPMQAVYMTTMSLTSHIEYQFASNVDGNGSYTIANNFEGTGDVTEIPFFAL